LPLNPGTFKWLAPKVPANYSFIVYILFLHISVVGTQPFMYLASMAASVL
jgi:hypothetical protein